jgi:hypothetical protein
MENLNLGVNKSFPESKPPKEKDQEELGNSGFRDVIGSFFSQTKTSETDLDPTRQSKLNDERIKLNTHNDDIENSGKDTDGQKEELSRTQKLLGFASMSYFRELFDINTDDVIERLKFALFPFKHGSIFDGKPYDLYGPIWILFTVVFTTSIFGTVFMATETMDKENATNASINHIGKSLTLIVFYTLVNPLIVFYLFNREGARSIKYFEIVSIYGYSFAILPILEVLLVIPLGYFSYILLLIAAFIS